MGTRCALLLFVFIAVWAGACAAQPPRVMLATEYRPDIRVEDYWVSEKLDGVRGHWDGHALWTRGGGRIAAPAWFVEGWPSVPLDGELWVARGRFDQVSAIVRAGQADDAAWRQVRFMVFDLPTHAGGFEARLARLRRLLDDAGVPWLLPVRQERLADGGALQARLKAVVAAGGEGLMLHHRDARYVAGRSSGLLKLKPWQDAEARVVGYTPGRGKYAGMTGALVVERPDGLRFRLGSGLDDAQRASPPPLGSLVTYRYSGVTGRGVPRFARFLRVRHDMPPMESR